MCTGAEGSGCIALGDRLSRRRLDRRRAVAPALRQAVVEPALLEHGIGEPDPAAHHDDEEKQQDRVGDPAVARGLHVFVVFRRFRLVHAVIVARECARRNGRSCSGCDATGSSGGRCAQVTKRGGAHPAMVSFTTLTSCLSVNGLARKLNCLRSGRVLSKASSALPHTKKILISGFRFFSFFISAGPSISGMTTSETTTSTWPPCLSSSASASRPLPASITV